MISELHLRPFPNDGAANLARTPITQQERFFPGPLVTPSLLSDFKVSTRAPSQSLDREPNPEQAFKIENRLMTHQTLTPPSDDNNNQQTKDDGDCIAEDTTDSVNRSLDTAVEQNGLTCKENIKQFSEKAAGLEGNEKRFQPDSLTEPETRQPNSEEGHIASDGSSSLSDVQANGHSGPESLDDIVDVGVQGSLQVVAAEACRLMDNDKKKIVSMAVINGDVIKVTETQAADGSFRALEPGPGNLDIAEKTLNVEKESEAKFGMEEFERKDLDDLRVKQEIVVANAALATSEPPDLRSLESELNSELSKAKQAEVTDSVELKTFAEQKTNVNDTNQDVDDDDDNDAEDEEFVIPGSGVTVPIQRPNFTTCNSRKKPYFHLLRLKEKKKYSSESLQNVLKMKRTLPAQDNRVAVLRKVYSILDGGKCIAILDM